MTCERIEEHLSELIDNELDPQTAEEVNRHLANCPVCHNEFEELRLIVQQSAVLEQLDPPDHLYWTIRNKARSAQPRSRFVPRKIGWVLVPALATAALMLLLFPRNRTETVKADLPMPARPRLTPAVRRRRRWNRQSANRRRSRAPKPRPPLHAAFGNVFVTGPRRTGDCPGCGLAGDAHRGRAADVRRAAAVLYQLRGARQYAQHSAGA